MLSLGLSVGADTLLDDCSLAVCDCRGLTRPSDRSCDRSAVSLDAVMQKESKKNGCDANKFSTSNFIT